MNSTSGGKRIVIIRNAFSYDFGGGERMPVHLAHELQKNGYKPYIVSRSPKLLEYAQSFDIVTIKGRWWARQDWSGKKILLTPFYFLWQVVLFAWYLRLFLKIKPDVVHAQSKDDFIAATLAGKILRKPVFWTDHADIKYLYWNHPVWYKNPIGKVVAFCSRFTEKIILTSENDKRLIEQAYGKKLPERYEVIYDGVFDQPAIIKKRPADEKIIFVATSRLVTAKGIGELIEAFKKIKSAHPAAELQLFGEGPEEEKFRKLAKGEKSIKFMGFPEDSLAQAARADVFMHPSYLEGFSISLIEATMLGLPIIACRVGGNPEIITEKNGILVSDQNVEELAEAMAKLASDKNLRQKMALNSRQTFEKSYDFEKIVKEQYLPLYE